MDYLIIESHLSADDLILSGKLSGSMLSETIVYSFAIDSEIVMGDLIYDLFVIESTRDASFDPAVQYLRDISYNARVGHGRKLFEKIFIESPSGAEAWTKILARDLKEIEIFIVSKDQRTLALPWEIIYSPDLQQFPLLSAKSLSRQFDYPILPESQGTICKTSDSAFRILFVVMRPGGVNDISSYHILNEVLGNSSVFISEECCFDLQPGGTFQDFQSRLQDAKEAGKPYSAVHFDGHGDYVINAFGKAKGVLYFESLKSSSPESIDAELFGNVCLSNGIDIVLLNACRSDMSRYHRYLKTIEGESFAYQLNKMGVGTVLAMSCELTTSLAASLFRHLYEGLFGKYNQVSKAINYARRKVLNTIYGEGESTLTGERLGPIIVPRVYQNTIFEWPSVDFSLIYPQDPFNSKWLREKVYEVFYATHHDYVTVVTFLPGSGSYEVSGALYDAIGRSGVASQNIVMVDGNKLENELDTIFEIGHESENRIFIIVDQATVHVAEQIIKKNDEFRDQNIKIIVFCSRFAIINTEYFNDAVHIGPHDEFDPHDILWDIDKMHHVDTVDKTTHLAYIVWMVTDQLVGLARSILHELLLNNLKNDIDMFSFLGLGSGDDKCNDLNEVSQKYRPTLGLYRQPECTALKQYIENVEKGLESIVTTQEERKAIQLLFFCGYSFSYRKILSFAELDCSNKCTTIAWSELEWYAFLKKCESIGLLYEKNPGSYKRFPWSIGVMDRFIKAGRLDSNENLLWSQCHEKSLSSLLWKVIDEFRWNPHDKQNRQIIEDELNSLVAMSSQTSIELETQLFFSYFLALGEHLLHGEPDVAKLEPFINNEVNERIPQDSLSDFQYSLIYDLQGRIHERKGDFTKAEDCYLLALKLYQDRQSYVRLGVFQSMSVNNYEEALRYLNQATTTKGPKEFCNIDAAIMYYRATLFQLIGDNLSAINEYKALIKQHYSQDLSAFKARSYLELATLTKETSADPLDVNVKERLIGYYLRSSDESESLGSHDLRLRAYYGIISLAINDKKFYPITEKYLCKLIGLASKIDNFHYLSLGYYTFASLYRSSGRLNEANMFVSCIRKLPRDQLGTHILNFIDSEEE